MSILWILLIIAIPAIIFLFGWFMNKKGNEDFIKNNGSGEILHVYSDVVETTPSGLRIASKNGVSAEFKTRADVALSTLFKDAVKYGESRGIPYTQKLLHSDYIIYVLDDCTPSPEQRLLSFKLRADNYDGTYFDQDPRPGIGYVFASEYVIPQGNGLSNEYVICNDMINLENNVRYGAEHIIFYNNDLEEYQRTQTHSQTSGHPLIPSS